MALRSASGEECYAHRNVDYVGKRSVDLMAAEKLGVAIPAHA